MKRIWGRIKSRFTKTQTRGSWAGATISRLHDFVFGWIQSAHQELKGELVTLRGRGRELSRNNAYARRYLALLVENVVGPKGIRLQAQAKMRDGTLDQVSNNAIEAAWKDWGKVGNCDVTGELSWCEVEALAIATTARDGECFIRRVKNYDNSYRYAVQILDADQIDDTYDVAPGDGRNAVRMGVESNAWGRVQAFWMWTQHPQDQGSRERVRIPSAEITHLIRRRRAGQPRGETWFAPVMYEFRQLQGYTEAELVAARTSAAKMGFIEQGEGAEGPDPNLPVGTTQTMEASPGIIDRLGLGEKFVGWDPQHPSGNFGPFVGVVLRGIAAGLNVSYMALTGDLNGTSYSSGRIGSEQERDHYRMLHNWLSSHLHDVVYREWLRYAVLGPLKLAEVNFAKYENVVWRPRGFPYVDPEKDVEANRKAIASGFKSPAEIIAESGNEIEDVYEQIAYAKQLAASYGLELDYGVPKVPEPVPPVEPKKDEEADADRKTIVALARSIDGSTKWAAQKDTPPPVIHNHIEPKIDVDARTTVEPAQITVTTPDVRLEPHINVEAARPADAPVVNIAPTEVRIEPTVVNVTTPEVRNEITVPPSAVTVEAPKRSKKVVKIRNAKGDVLRTAELSED